MKARKLSRRQFLVASAASVAVIAGGAVAVAKLAQPDGGDIPATYYALHQKSIMASFDETMTFMRPFLAAKVGEADAEAVIKATRVEYAALILQLPYIGGDANELTGNLSQSAGALAFYRVMKARGRPVEEVGEILYKGYEAQMANTPAWVLSIWGVLQSMGLDAGQAEKDAATSQQRAYPGDWVTTYVKGDGQSFDWGVDYTECGICKFFHAQGADELTPYLCQLDYPASRVYNQGLERTETLAQGGRRCDFRYKRGRPTPSGWPPPWLKG